MLTLDQVVERVNLAITNQKRFALIRIGDGEGRILMYPDHISRHMLNRHLRFWFGHQKFSDGDLIGIKNYLESAIVQASILGYSEHPKNKYWAYATDYAKKVLGRSWIKGCTINVHINLWREGKFDALLANAKKVRLVTCREEVLGDFKKRYSHLEIIELIPIPEEGNTGGSPQEHYSEHFDDIVNHLRHGDDWVYLIGAGVLGKIYAFEAKMAGSVAIDIGSLFDAWAGVKSRSFMTNMDEWKLVPAEAPAWETAIMEHHGLGDPGLIGELSDREILDVDGVGEAYLEKAREKYPKTGQEK